MDSSTSQMPTKKKNSKLKKAFCFAGIFLIIFSCCAGSIGFAWAGGYVKELACSSSKKGSSIYKEFDCEDKTTENSTTISQGDNVINVEIPKEVQSTEELVTKIIEEVGKGVVTVAVNDMVFDPEKGVVGKEDGIGSGFVVDSNGLIITNQHVVADETLEYSIILPGEKEAIPVSKVYKDNVDDIAILKVEKKGLPALKLGDSSLLKRGNLVIAIGNPLGELEGTSTVGFITGLNRDVDAGSGFMGSSRHYESVIQTDAAINPGNSGGPLINSKGEVIGINFATTKGADNISFAIPINRVKERIAVFKKEGRFPQPFIGVTYQQRTFQIKKELITGALIYSVEQNSPAANAGIKKGDIVLKANGIELAKKSFNSIIAETGVGKELSLEVLRAGEKINITVIVGDRGK